VRGVLSTTEAPPARTVPVADGGELTGGWRLNPLVDIRPESFGAMAYHFGTRRLSFLKSRRLLEVVRGLEGHPDAAAACRAHGVPERELATYASALRTLAETDMIVPRASGSAPAGIARTGASATLAGAASGASMPHPPDSGALARRSGTPLVERFQFGLDAPICLTWELTYACNLACTHCLSSSGRRDPGELSTEECMRVIDELEAMQVFYVNVGGGEPTIRRDFFELLEYATAHHVGVKFSTNGTRITPRVADQLAASDYVDVQISIDGATAAVNDAVRGSGSYAAARQAMENLAGAGFEGFKLSVVVTRHNVDQLDELKAIADLYGAQLRVTRLRPSGRAVDVWDELHPTADQQRQLYDWLLEHGERVLTGDSFFHLAGYGEALPGLNLCGAGRVVCLIDPVGDVYACPFAIHEQFRAGNVRTPGGFAGVWRESELFAGLRQPQTGGACQACSAFDSCRGGCMAAKFFTGLPLDGPDPECVKGHGASARQSARPEPSVDHSRPPSSVPVALVRRPPARACDESPLAGLALSGQGSFGPG
jgi:[mycofactocin precursor peptide]-tyrosine decarboxylase / 3-amino-5-[(4-hydroxyphenyl)methyl]-4,4-dimethylpyrrolidin-2-one synthase